MIISRTKNTVSGTVFGWIERFSTLVFPFIIRTVFIRTLGAEYLGLNSLFASILQVLNLAELGVGSALVFSMYKPIADGDQKKICALMNLYKQYYYIIGLVVLLAGLAVLPILRLLIKGEVPADINIYILYFMQLCSTVLTYWVFAYRNCLFQAHQRLDIVSIISTLCHFFQYALQILAIIVYRNYYVYLAIAIICQLLLNVLTAIISKKMFPGLSPKGNLAKQEVQTINCKVRDLFTAKLGSVVSNSFDTIVVSAFLGLTTLAIYQNYFYIVSAISGFLMVFFTALQAGVGNFLVTRSKEDARQLLYRINFIVMLIVNICCCCLCTLFQPFMTIWMGEEYLLDYPLVVMFAVYLYAYIAIRPIILFKDAGGIWKEDRFRPLISSLVNLCLNLLTVKKFGFYGVLGSTIVSYMMVGLPWLIFNIDKHMFKLNMKKFILREMMYSIVISVSCAITVFLCSQVFVDNVYVTMIVNFAVSVIVPSILFVSLFFRTTECKFFLSLVNDVRNKF